MPWSLLGYGFLYMTLDEVFSAHELIIAPLQQLADWPGFLMLTWVIVAIPVVALVGLAFVPFLRRLPRPTRTRLIVAGAVYVFGAVVMEMVGAQAIELTGRSFYFAACFTIEESCEMAGILLGIRAMLLHLAETTGGISISFGTDPASRPR